MIDTHCHVLYGMDDGAQTFQTSLDMCRTAVENQIDGLILTPHYDGKQLLKEFLDERDTKINELRDELKQKNIPVELYPGAECLVGEYMFDELNLAPLTLNNSRYLLIEFPFRGMYPGKMLSYVDKLVESGYVPVLAHPERYAYIQADYDFLNYLYGHGARFQITAASLAGLGTKEEFMISYELMRKNLVSLIASDAHDTYGRGINIQERLVRFPREFSVSYIKQLTKYNPETVLHNSELPNPEVGIAKKRFLLFKLFFSSK